MYMVYAVLVSHTRPEQGRNTCWPGIDRVAEYASLSPRSVRRAIVKLEDAGYIEVRRKRGRVNGYYVPPLICGKSEATQAALQEDRATERGQTGRTYGQNRHESTATQAYKGYERSTSIKDTQKRDSKNDSSSVNNCNECEEGLVRLKNEAFALCSRCQGSGIDYTG